MGNEINKKQLANGPDFRKSTSTLHEKKCPFLLEGKGGKHSDLCIGEETKKRTEG